MNIPLILNYLRPNEQWSLDGNDYDGLIWLDETEKPTLAEIEAIADEAQAAYQAAIEAKAAARQSALAKLAELGLTEEEIAAL